MFSYRGRGSGKHGQDPGPAMGKTRSFARFLPLGIPAQLSMCDVYADLSEGSHAQHEDFGRSMTQS